MKKIYINSITLKYPTIKLDPSVKLSDINNLNK